MLSEVIEDATESVRGIVVACRGGCPSGCGTLPLGVEIDMGVDVGGVKILLAVLRTELSRRRVRGLLRRSGIGPVLGTFMSRNTPGNLTVRKGSVSSSFSKGTPSSSVTRALAWPSLANVSSVRA